MSFGWTWRTDQSLGFISRFKRETKAKSVSSLLQPLQRVAGDNGGPGERAYHPGYYAAFVLDPDGNNIEAVYHGPVHKSAESIVVTPLD